MKKIILLIFALCLIGIAGCGKEEEKVETYQTIGIIKYFPPPDNCNDYMFEVENNLYKPNRLSDEFKIDNLPVKITYSISDENYNCGFGGYVSIINILKIEKL